MEVLTGMPGSSDHKATAEISGAERKSTFSSFPLDVLFLVLFDLDIGSLLVCRQVCRLLADIVSNDVRLQYKIELAITGMVDGPPSAISVADRLRRLREYKTNYVNGHYVSSSQSASSYASGASRTIGQWRKLSVMDIPGIPQGCQIKLVDIAQDLLVLSQQIRGTAEVSVFLVSLANLGQPHPSAIQHVIHTSCPFAQEYEDDSGLGSLNIQIFGRSIALVMEPQSASEPCFIEVWDWHRGCLTMRHTLDQLVDFAFIDASHLVYTKNHKLLVYRCAPRPEDASSVLSNPPAALKLGLPFSSRYWMNDIRGPAPPSSTCSFYPDPDLSVLPIDFYFTHRDSSAARGKRQFKYTILIPRATFMTHIERASSSGRTSMLAWKEWGPDGSLVLVRPDSIGRHNKVAYLSYGSRLAALEYNHEHPPSARVLIYDVNPWAAKDARRHAANVSDESTGTDLTVDGRKVFPQTPGAIPYAVYPGKAWFKIEEDAWTFRLDTDCDGFTLHHLRDSNRLVVYESHSLQA